MKVILSILICALLAFSVSARSTKGKSSNIQLEVFSGSNQYWLAVAVRGANADTSSLQVQDSSSAWLSMEYTPDWGFWSVSTLSKLKFPLTFRLTSVSGEQLTVSKKVNSLTDGKVDAGVQYGNAPAATPAAATAKPTAKPTSAPTKAPTAAPTKAPTAAPTKAPSKATTKPNKATSAPTKAPTSAPTSKATTAPTKASVPSKTASSSGSGCSAPLKLMVPLYVYPGAAWDAVAAGGKLAPTVAIINPSNGPGNGPDKSYNTYMKRLADAGVEIIGYVHTSWGARSIADVKKDIDLYASAFPLVEGIFLDEASTEESQLPYYQELYRYIMSMPGWKYDVINPGANPAAGYLDAATQIVSFEDTSSKFSASSKPSYASCSNKDKFAVITYAASGNSDMQSVLSAAKSKEYYGWVYVTDGAGGCCTYNNLASYYPAQAEYVASMNN